MVPNGPGSVTHTYVSSSGKRRPYYMHFVTLRKLEASTHYFYRVRSGGVPAGPHEIGDWWNEGPV